MSKAITAWVTQTTGHSPKDPALFERALTHSSHGDEHYERLEFLGDRVLGLTVAAWLFELFPHEPEGKLSRRLNALVAGDVCAEVGREIGVPDQLKLGKQAREDGASDSDNVVGDVVEALIGALFLERGFATAAEFVRRAWADRVNTHDKAPKHPKSELQEWAAANNRRPPVYSLADRSGPHHAPRFVVSVEIAGIGAANAEGASKQEAETAAAAKLMEQLQ
ncbi:MAG TPA: ribonuclease III [Allosphingosinicella sp.]|nr:ribonuclease III [Allosphingosinicella sp.]